MKMSSVQKCDATECAYNIDNQCHTPAITIGDQPSSPLCDTFCACGSKGGDGAVQAGVGACKVSACEYNTSLECQAPQVMVGHQNDSVQCLTFKKR